MKFILGIDPGVNGAIALSTVDFSQIYAYPINQLPNTLSNQSALIVGIVLEQVQGFPHDGAKRAFRFGENYGWIQGLLQATDFEKTPVIWKRLPQQWQSVAHAGLSRKIPPKKRSKLICEGLADKIIFRECSKNPAIPIPAYAHDAVCISLSWFPVEKCSFET